MSNILEAICNIVEHESYEISHLYTGRNRANSMGDTLERFIKDAFANTLHIDDETEKLIHYSERFSWLGSQNNPPDIMLRQGDAIEVKKTQSANSSLALNSSYPKAYLDINNPMITKGCQQCESWQRKDLIYCVGHTSDTLLHSLWMVYGSIYAADDDIYQRIKNTITHGIKTIPDVVFSETKELGRVNQVDPLGITNLRIRGMWQIDNPRRVFDYLHKPVGRDFELVCLIPTDKYNNFSQQSKDRIESLALEEFAIEDRKVKDPNNPAKLISCKLITYLI